MGSCDWHSDEVMLGAAVGGVLCREERSHSPFGICAALLSRCGGASLMLPPLVWGWGGVVRSEVGVGVWVRFWVVLGVVWSADVGVGVGVGMCA